MEDSNVPAHHVQREFCTTRPAYRQGRELKAVKVYTVNNESKYLLIQGVPAVGAGQELIKLCAMYGAVEEYRVLDDYPTPDKFTEVYWVKFTRIQSARFAKRKLDNHSFFGGVLHICYAPEYETLEDTREKLQERRKVIAMKTRQHEATSNSSVDPSSQAEQTETETNNPELDQPTSAGALPAIAQQKEQHKMELIPTQIAPPYFTLQIPPPPQVMYAGGLPPQYQPRTFDHARAPSSHATLPHGYDPRKHNPGLQELSPFSSSKAVDSIKQDISTQSLQLKNNKPSTTYSDVKPRDGDTHRLEGGKASVPSDLANSKTKVVVKDFIKSGAVPKFVPRQAEAAMKRLGQSVLKGESDKLGQQIRRHAVTLQDKAQGPRLPDGRVHSQDPLPPEDVSVNKSVQEIRRKLTQFSEGQPLKKKIKPS
ncbi:RNA-binding protein 48-like [Liolophura sinensis]|uniref:RNA-binding protein 48-like n=1 Tax=Liolophura sinensis TaxID=3198878 RepID=UPI0031580630